MITVHHLNNSRSQRVLWLLEELGIPYELKRYQRDPKTMLAPRELKAVHPLGKSPVITDGDRTLAESAAIIEYLVDRHGGGKLRPAADTEERMRYTYWLHYAEGSLMPQLLLALVFQKIGEAPVPFFLKPVVKGISAKGLKQFVQPNIETHLDFIEGELKNRDWLCGSEFSAADVQMSFPLEAGKARAGLGNRPKLNEYVSRLHERPAYARALERGGPYDYA